jgi:hypothetical protein
MAQTHVVSALLEKRSELVGLLEFKHKEITQISNELNHIESTLMIFSPHVNFATQKPKQYQMRFSPFKQGELPVLIMNLLRDSNKPLATNEIAYQLAQLRGLPAEKDYDCVVKPVHSALQRMRSKGVVTPIVRTTGPGGGANVWECISSNTSWTF